MNLRSLFSCTIPIILVSQVMANPNKQPRNLFSQIESFGNSVLGISTSAAPTATAGAAVSQPTVNQATATPSPQPASAATTPSTTALSPTSSIDSYFPSSPSPTSSDTSTDSPTSVSDTLTTSTSTSSASTQSGSSAIQTPVQGPPTSSASPQASKSGSSNGVPPAGIAVAVIFSILVVAAIAYLAIKYTPCIQRKLEIREEQRRAARTYRPALDPDVERFAQGEEKGLGLGDVSSLKTSSFELKDKPGDFTQRPLSFSPEPTISPIDGTPSTGLIANAVSYHPFRRSQVGVAAAWGGGQKAAVKPAIPRKPLPGDSRVKRFSGMLLRS